MRPAILNTSSATNKTASSYLLQKVSNSIGAYTYSWLPTAQITSLFLTCINWGVPSSINIICNYLIYADPLDKILEIINKKKLSKDLFHKKLDSCTLDSSLAEHAIWIFQNIYSKPYPQTNFFVNGISRLCHGMQHVSRTALFVKIFTNLYRKHGNASAIELTDLDVKILQIGALFHDSARENDEADLWDHESALLYYFYLTNILDIEHYKAKLFAEAVANKDLNPQGYFEIIEVNSSQHSNIDSWITWQFNPSKNYRNETKNILSSVMHDADSIDILRVKDFEIGYLDFYQDIVCEPNDLAFEDLALLVLEAKCIIQSQGDKYDKIDYRKKRLYESADGYQKVELDFSQSDFPILSALSPRLLSVEELKSLSFVDKTTFDPLASLTDENINILLQKGGIYLRSIDNPQKISKNETSGTKEIRKAMRAEGIPTRSGRLKKTGNYLRSFTVAGYGVEPFSCAGFYLANPSIENIHAIFFSDMDTGFGKKPKLSIKDNITTEQAFALLEALRIIIREGSLATRFSNGVVANHNEILMQVMKYDGVYYTNDGDFKSQCRRKGQFNPYHHYTAFVQAVFLQKEYALQYKLTKQNYQNTFGEEQGLVKFIERFGLNENLPIFEYLPLKNKLRRVSEYELSDTHLIAVWKKMCTDYLLAYLLKYKIFSINLDNINRLKKMSPLGNNFIEVRNIVSLDSNYPEALLEKINDAVIKESNEIIARKSFCKANMFKENVSSNFSGHQYLKSICAL